MLPLCILRSDPQSLWTMTKSATCERWHTGHRFRGAPNTKEMDVGPEAGELKLQMGKKGWRDFLQSSLLSAYIFRGSAFLPGTGINFQRGLIALFEGKKVIASQFNWMWLDELPRMVCLSSFSKGDWKSSDEQRKPALGPKLLGVQNVNTALVFSVETSGHIYLLLFTLQH